MHTCLDTFVAHALIEEQRPFRSICHIAMHFSQPRRCRTHNTSKVEMNYLPLTQIIFLMFGLLSKYAFLNVTVVLKML